MAQGPAFADLATGPALMIHLSILICALSAPTCTAESARVALPMPAVYATPSACLAAGLVTLAATRIGRDVGPGEMLRVQCR